MKRRFCVLLAVCLLLFLLPAGALAQSAPMTAKEFAGIAQSMIEKYDAPAAQKTPALRRAQTEAAQETPADPYESGRLIAVSETRPSAPGALEVAGGYEHFWLIQYADAAAAAAGEKALKTQAGVQCVSPDVKITLCDSGETGYSYQSWGPAAIHADTMNQALLKRFDGADKLPQVIVAVVDSGVDSDHPLLAGRLLTGVNLTSDDKTNVEDANGHGTHVAGILADTTLPNVKILPIKVAANRTFDSSLALGAIGIAEESGASVINMSFGISGGYPDLEVMIESAYEKGVLSVAAAGNGGTDASALTPANVDCALTVSNIQQNNTLNSTSNYGGVIDLAAPGTGIASSYLNGGYKSLSGTSMATPFVSAAAAMVETELGAASTPARVSRLLCQNAKDLGDPGKDDQFGYGLVDLENMDEACSAPTSVTLTGAEQCGQLLTAQADMSDCVYTWYVGSDAETWTEISNSGNTLTLLPAYLGKQIKVVAKGLSGVGTACAVSAAVQNFVVFEEQDDGASLLLQPGGSAPAGSAYFYAVYTSNGKLSSACALSAAAPIPLPQSGWRVKAFWLQEDTRAPVCPAAEYTAP
jgi:subtilisin family serine protease